MRASDPKGVEDQAPWLAWVPGATPCAGAVPSSMLAWGGEGRKVRGAYDSEAESRRRGRRKRG